MSTLYLSSKVEEESENRLRSIINVCYRTYHSELAPLDLDESFWALKNSVVQTELVIVRMLSFNMVFEHPHKVDLLSLLFRWFKIRKKLNSFLLTWKYLLIYLEAMRDWIPLFGGQSTPVTMMCWSLLNDLLHTDLFLNYRPQEVAISIIYLALQSYGIRMPFNNEAKISWWRVRAFFYSTS